MNRFCNFILAMSLVSSTAFAADDADWIVRARYLVTMDGDHRVIENGAMAVEGQRIVAVGTSAEVEAKYHAAQKFDAGDAAILPGLIDTHTHAPMSLFRALADDQRLSDWLQHFIFPAEAKNVNADFVRWGTRLACLEMALAGITTYTDMYYFEEAEAETVKEAGLRAVLGQSVIGFPAPDYKSWHDALHEGERFIEKYAHDDLITPAIAPHAIYTTPDEALVASHNLSRKYNVPLLIHLAETKKEHDDALSQRKMTPTATLEKLGLLDGRAVAAHCVWEDPADLRILRKHNVGVAHCPSSNTKLASGIAPVAEMLSMGIRVGLGTDGFAGSNDTADLIGEMSLASKLQKVNRMDPQVLPAEEALEMATIGGARVLGLDKEIGSLEEGKRADFIVMSLARPHAVPLYNIYSQLVYTSKAADVQDVFVNGRPVVRGRKMLTLNEAEVVNKAQEYGRKVSASIKR